MLRNSLRFSFHPFVWVFITRLSGKWPITFDLMMAELRFLGDSAICCYWVFQGYSFLQLLPPVHALGGRYGSFLCVPFLVHQVIVGVIFAQPRQ